MACANQMHQTIILTQTESDNEEIDVVTVDLNDDEKLSQDLEFDLLSKIEFEIDSDSADEFVDVVTVSPIKHASPKVQMNKNGVNEPLHRLCEVTVNDFSTTKLNNDFKEQCFTTKTSKRKVDELGHNFNGVAGTTDVIKLRSSVKMILSKTDVNSNDNTEDEKSMKKRFRKSLLQTSTSSRFTADTRNKRTNHRQTKGLKKAVFDKLDIGQTSLKPKRKCTQISRKNNNYK